MKPTPLSPRLVPKLMDLELKAIRIDGGTQPRCQIDENVVADYAETIAQGPSWPPPTVFFDGKEYWLADGFHRWHALKKVGAKTVQVEVYNGLRRDAVLYSCGANATHGLRRSNADKRRAVRLIILDEEWTNWSNVEIARRCVVDDHLVASVREEVEAERKMSLRESEVRPDTRQYINKHGTVSKMNTTNIGKRRPPPPIEGGPPEPLTIIPPPPPMDEDGEISLRESEVRTDDPPPTKGMRPAGRDVPTQLVDKVGRIVPHEVEGLWLRAQEGQDLLTAISRVRSAVRKACDDRDPLFAEVGFSFVDTYLERAYGSLKTVLPFAVCPGCHGILPGGCRLCSGRGLISEHKWNAVVTSEQKDAVRKEVESYGQPA